MMWQIFLGYKNPWDAFFRHVNECDKRTSGFPTPSGRQQMNIINESGLYSLVLGSRLPKAQEFKHWVTSEVLPSIRKNRGYFADQNDMLIQQQAMFKSLINEVLDEREYKGYEKMFYNHRAITFNQFCKMLFFKHGLKITSNELLNCLIVNEKLNNEGLPNYGFHRWFTITEQDNINLKINPVAISLIEELVLSNAIMRIEQE